MSSKLALITIILFLAAATASSIRFAIPQHTASDIEEFAKGFLKGITNGPAFDEIKACLSESQVFMSDIDTAILLISTKDPVKVKQGIIILGYAVQIIPEAARDCGAAEKEIDKLIALVESFKNPTSFFYHVGKSLLINKVEIIHEVTSAVSAYEDQDYEGVGFWVGSAMYTIFLGLDRPLSQGLVDFLNQEQDSFTSELPEKFKGMTLAEIKAQFLGAIPDEITDINVWDYEGQVRDIPTDFDSAKQWPGCVHSIRDQGHCGSCWAFAASEVLSDRFCIASDKRVNVVLSPQYLVSCDSGDFGCNGGYPVVAWRFIISNGLVTDDCWPYASYNGTVPKCSSFTQCADGSEMRKYYGVANSLVQLSNPTSIQTNILQYGPVEAAFTVYEDFLSYKSGIYKHTSGSLLGGHAVKIVGWGREDGTDYWLVSNSWGTSWGINGQFKIAFGQVGIDRAVTTVQADITRYSDTRNEFAWWTSGV